jgi:hypothetical protein
MLRFTPGHVPGCFHNFLIEVTTCEFLTGLHALL